MLSGFPQNSNNSNLESKKDKLQAESRKYYIDYISIEGNKRTKSSVILRELLFEQGDSIYNNQIERSIQRSKENLINTSLFNYVTIIFLKQSDNKINISISVEERWYTWPIPILEHADRNLSSWLRRKDMSMINYGISALQENFRGRRELFKIKARFGFKEQYSLLYIKPFIDKNKKHGLAVEIAYNRQKRIIVNTKENKPNYLTGNDDYLLNYFYTYIYYIYRPRLNSSHVISAGYNDVNTNKIIQDHNPWFNLEGEDRMVYNTLSYDFIRDLRDLQVYPLRGSFINLGIKKQGLGINTTSPNLLKFSMTYRKYYCPIKRFYFAHDLSAKKSIGKYEPYFLSRGMGYDKIGRAHV